MYLYPVQINKVPVDYPHVLNAIKDESQGY